MRDVQGIEYFGHRCRTHGETGWVIFDAKVISKDLDLHPSDFTIDTSKHLGDLIAVRGFSLGVVLQVIMNRPKASFSFAQEVDLDLTGWPPFGTRSKKPINPYNFLSFLYESINYLAIACGIALALFTLFAVYTVLPDIPSGGGSSDSISDIYRDRR